MRARISPMSGEDPGSSRKRSRSAVLGAQRLARACCAARNSRHDRGRLLLQHRRAIRIVELQIDAARTNRRRGWRMLGIASTCGAPLEGGHQSPVALLQRGRGRVVQRRRNDVLRLPGVRRICSAGSLRHPAAPANAIDAPSSWTNSRRELPPISDAPGGTRPTARGALALLSCATACAVAGLFSGNEEWATSAMACRAARSRATCIAS